jgi:hypothetical protein
LVGFSLRSNRRRITRDTLPCHGASGSRSLPTPVQLHPIHNSVAGTQPHLLAPLLRTLPGTACSPKHHYPCVTSFFERKALLLCTRIAQWLFGPTHLERAHFEIKIKDFVAMADWRHIRFNLQIAIAAFLLCLLATPAAAWGVVLFHASRNCSSDTVSFARLCKANQCCTAIAYSPADQMQSAIGAMGFCANGRVIGKLFAAYGAPPRATRTPHLLNPSCRLLWRGLIHF